jgi:hypothetical protein
MRNSAKQEKPTLRKKRGRPRLIDDARVAWLQGIYPHIGTRRGILNKHYQIRAARVVSAMRGTEFLFDPKKETTNPSVLTELGRLPTEQDIRIVARYICKRARREHLTTKECERILRQIRLSQGEI